MKTWLCLSRLSVLFVILLFLYVSSLFSAFLASPRAYAQSGDWPCMPPAYAPRHTVRLADKIPESATTSTPNVFYSSTSTVTINSDDRICISSSPTGRAPLKVDDLLSLRVTHADGSMAEWAYNFYDPATDGITTTTARDVSGLFRIGENKVVVALSDLKLHRFSAEPIWLVVWKDPTAMPIASLKPSTAVPTTPMTGSPVPPTESVIATQTTPPPALATTPSVRTPTPDPIASWLDAFTPLWLFCLGGLIAFFLLMVLVVHFVLNRRDASLNSAIKQNNLDDVWKELDRLHTQSGNPFEKRYVAAVSSLYGNASEEQREKIVAYLVECYNLRDGYYRNAAKDTIQKILAQHIQEKDNLNNYLVFSTRIRRQIQLKRKERLVQEAKADAELFAIAGWEESKDATR